MINRKSLFSILISLLIVGCQIQVPAPENGLFPTPFQETLEADETHSRANITLLPTETITLPPTKTLPTDTPVPTKTQIRTTQIFPQATQPIYPEYPELTEQIDQIILQAGGRWHVVIKEVDGPIYYSLLSEQRINIASVVKVPLAFLFFEALEQKGIAEPQLADHLKSTGTGGRTFEQLLQAMIVTSEEDATDILLEYIGVFVNVPAQLRAWQLEGIDLNARRYTVEGVASLLERFYLGDFVNLTAQKIILDYLSEYTPNDDTRIGILRFSIPESYQIFNKRGSLLTPYVVADSAIIENPVGPDYIITLFAYNSEPETTYEVLDKTIGDITLAFWDYIATDGN